MLKTLLQLLLIAGLTLSAQAAYGQAYEEFLKAVERGDAKVVAELLDKGLDPNTADPKGNTALMMAARLGHENLVALLLERKANVRARTPHGDTALMMASLGGHLGIAKMLIERGAEVRQPGWAPVHYAAFMGHAEMIRFLLDLGADKDAVAPNGYTALMLAARGGHWEAARVLLQEDADLRHKGPNGETALAIARLRGDRRLEELLRRAGAVE